MPNTKKPSSSKASRRPRRRPAETAEGLQTRRVPLSKLNFDPQNARKHGEENLAAIRDSLRRFGQVVPLVVLAGTGKVIGGNGTLAAMRELRYTHADIVEFAGDEAEAAALAIALNRTAELAEWDNEQLARTLQELGELPGYSAEEIDQLVAEALGTPAEAPPATRHVEFDAEEREPDDSEPAAPTPPARAYRMQVECRTQKQRTELLERLTNEGLTCRVLK